MADWREQFTVWGRYREETLAGRVWPLRSHLEIVDQRLDPRQAFASAADLVAVMMNPGASRPLAEPDREGWSPAQPDRTQLQLMRLARALEQRGLRLRHIRVINLSDLRTPQSADLLRALAGLAAAGEERHSLFAAARQNDLRAALGPSSTPVLRAWGLAAGLVSWGERALQATAGHPTLGLAGEGTGFRHPLPQRADLQKQWLDAVLAQALALPAGAWRAA
jgi:hypothetical protein